MAIELPAKDCEHMFAYKREPLGLDAVSVSKALTHTIGPPTKLGPCASSLVMGDLNAVDYATGLMIMYFCLAARCRPISVYDMASRYPGVTYCTL